MEIKVDLHNHPTGKYPRIINTVLKNLGQKGVLGYVNYADTDPYSKFLGTIRTDIKNLENAIYLEEDVLIIRGQEIPTTLSNGKIGEVVVFGLKQNLPIHLKLEELLKRAKGEGGVIYGPHPFLPDSIGRELKKNPKLIEYFHALEIYNSQAGLFDGLGPINVNKKAQEFYENEIKENYSIGALSSTDRFRIGKSYSILDPLDLKDSDTLVNSLKQNIIKHKDTSQDRQSPLRMLSLIHATKVLTFDKILANIPYINDWLKKHELIH